MDSMTELTITVRVDTDSARREVEDFRLYALRVIEELRAAYASLGPAPDVLAGGAEGGGPGRKRRV